MATMMKDLHNTTLELLGGKCFARAVLVISPCFHSNVNVKNPCI